MVPLGLDTLAPGGLVYDFVREPFETELVRAPAARGVATINGLEDAYRLGSAIVRGSVRDERAAGI